MNMKQILDQMIRDLKKLRFKSPVSFVYNPLEYARNSHDAYFDLFGSVPKEVLMLGMNPGPWGMVQTGVPFGEVSLVKDWLGINMPVGQPEKMHPKRQIEGFACNKSEVSGRRLWGWAKERFKTTELFFERFFIINYCPLVFMEESGRNRTPDKLPKAEKEQLFEICDRTLEQTVRYFQPRYVVGVGKFAEQRAESALDGLDVTIGRILHPSPANPLANKGWAEIAETELSKIGITGF